MVKRMKAALGYINKYKAVYIMLLPAIVYYVIFHYAPLGGIVIAFKKYNIFKGIAGSPWVGFANFEKLFKSDQFYRILRNTLIFGFLKIIVVFPAPIILSLMLNEVRSTKVKRVVQTTVYLPHFFSWVIVGGLVTQFLDPTRGTLNEIIRMFGGTPINFMAKPQYFRTIVTLSSLWKNTGWGTIVYLSAIAGLDQSPYEAAIVDGANRFQLIRYVTIPGIMMTICMVFIINMGNVLKNSFEQIFVLYNPLVYEVGDVIETYVYRTGLIDGRYDYSTAVGFFQSFVGLFFLMIANWLSNRISGKGIY